MQGGPAGASVRRVPTTPDVELDVRELVLADLAGTPAAALHRAGLVQERTAGSMAALDAGFSWPRLPYCRDYF